MRHRPAPPRPTGTTSSGFIASRSGRRYAGSAALALAVAAPVAHAQEGPGVGAAADLVSRMIAEHGSRLAVGAEPLLNDAAAARPYSVDTLAVDGLQGAIGADPIHGGQDA